MRNKTSKKMVKYLVVITFIILLSSTAVKCYWNTFNRRQVECNVRSYGITTAEQLQEAINKAKSGDTIRLDPIDYFGSFQINNSNIDYITIEFL